uniref:Uncharacterized protein n=1 Tax=Arundo donax TaxID=35708 RepID=A0A0A9HD83_ARUDO
MESLSISPSTMIISCARFISSRPYKILSVFASCENFFETSLYLQPTRTPSRLYVKAIAILLFQLRCITLFLLSVSADIILSEKYVTSSSQSGSRLRSSSLSFL